MLANLHEWQPLTLAEVHHLLRPLAIPWWVAGGVAIDLFVGRTVRHHNDLDIQVLRTDQSVVQEHLAGWDLHKTRQPGLKPWPKGEYLAPGVNQVWCRRTDRSPWALEIMFLETEGDEWVFRREPGIRGPLARFGRETRDGIPYVAPQIQLLFKAREVEEPKNEQGFAAVLPLLDSEERQWLLSALEAQFGGLHPWVRQLRQAPIRMPHHLTKGRFSPK